MENASLMILIALVQDTWFTVRTGIKRGEHKVEAPAITGNDVWERLFRVQQNTLEQLIIFIPAILIFSYYVSSKWVLIPGALYLIGRQIYSMTYIKNPKNRTVGMSLTFAANVILMLGGLYGVLRGVF